MDEMNRIANRRPIGLALRFAFREMRGGLSGFYVFLACIALGVAAITGVHSVAASIGNGIAAQGQAILGGDLAVSIVQRDLPRPLVQYLSDRGEVARMVTMRAMARRGDGADQTLVELKAVDSAYPLFGELRSGEPEQPYVTPAADRVWADPVLLERLAIAPGGELQLGRAVFIVEATIAAEPDRLSGGMEFGPRVLISHEGLERTGLRQPGSLFQTRLSVRLPQGDAASLERAIGFIRANYGDAGIRITSRENAAPSLARNIERFSQFLSLVGLAALVVGGVGVANAVRAYMEMKREVIAILKALGASGAFIFRLYLIQMLLLAGIGIVAGLLVGSAMPSLARWALQGVIPLPESTGPVLDPFALAAGTLYGLLTAFIFTVWPLGKARETQAAALFRSAGYAGREFPGPVYLAMLAVGAAALAGLAIYFSDSRQLAATFVAAVACSFVLLRGVASGIQWIAARTPPPSTAWLRMAVGNLHRRGSATPSVVLSLGLGLALISALTLIDGSLRNQISANLPQRAPDFFFVDIQNTEMDDFSDTVTQVAPEGRLESVPMLRGRITRLRGIDAADYKTQAGGWVLRGDRGITYAAAKPDNASLIAGAWWPPDYDGPPLVSFSAEEAEELGLNVGDEIEINVLGRNISAEIANLRHVEWETLAINFVMVFSPNTFAGAPHSWLSTLALPESGEEKVEARDGRILRQLGDAFPTVTAVRVRDALEQVNQLIGQLSNAVRAASSVALITSFLVLAGALAAGNRIRTHDAVILKTLGAKRGFLIRALVAEFSLLGLATAVFGLVAGGISAWYVVTQIMQFPANFQPAIAIMVAAIALAGTVGLGLAGTWRLLGLKAAPFLREN